MAVRLPLVLRILRLRPTVEGGPTEVDYAILDADQQVMETGVFSTLLANVEEVARYSIDRITAQLLQSSSVEMHDDVRAALGQPSASLTAPETATASLDQAISPVGVGSSKKARK